MGFRQNRTGRTLNYFSSVACSVAFAVAPYGIATAHATAKPKQTYALRIGIDNGRTRVRTGDRLTYVTKLSNTGAAETPDLLLSQTLVPGVKLISSTPKGTLSGDRITWNRVLPTGKTDQFSVTVEVGRLTGPAQRLAAVVCASTKAGIRPIVCASHLDLLGDSATDRTRSGALRSGWVIWCAIAGAGVFLAASVMLFRRRRTPANG